MTNKKEPKTYIITEDVLSRIRETVGSQIPETGGILGSSDGKHVDHFYFDVTASVTGAMSGDSLTVRSFKSVIEGYLAPVFARAEVVENRTYRLEGTLEEPQMIAENRAR